MLDRLSWSFAMPPAPTSNQRSSSTQFNFGVARSEALRSAWQSALEHALREASERATLTCRQKYGWQKNKTLSTATNSGLLAPTVDLK